MAEYECWCIWNTQNPDMDSNIDPLSLGLPQDLVADLVEWMDDYEVTYNRLDPIRSGFKDIEQVIAFNRSGESLKNRLKAALPEIEWEFIPCCVKPDY